MLPQRDIANPAAALGAGKAYPADITFRYERFTTGATYSHAVSETRTNTHVAGDVVVEAPAPALEPLWVRAQFMKTDGGRFKGTDLYAFVLFQAPGGLFFVEPLTDDGLGFDPGANDGIYAGSLDLYRAYRLLLSQDAAGRARAVARVPVRPGREPDQAGHAA